MTVPKAPSPPSAPRRTGPRKPASPIAKAQQGMSRNLLVLGVVTLVVLGGVGVFLASKNGGNAFNLFQNITQQIINNSYFTQLIADGVTTKQDLEAIAEIRPYGDGFIGVSKEALDWEAARALAGRTGARVLSTESGGIASNEDLLDWLGATFGAHLDAPTWLLFRHEPVILLGGEIVEVKMPTGDRRVLLQWRPTREFNAANMIKRVTDLMQVARQQPRSPDSSWKLDETQSLLLKGKGIEFHHSCESDSYDVELEFSLVSETVGSIHLDFPTSGGRCGWVMQLFKEHPGPFWGFGILDGVHYAFAKEARVTENYPELFRTGKRYQTKVEVRDGAVTGYLDGRLLVHWEGDLSRFQSEGRDLSSPRHLVFGGQDSFRLHKATITEFVPLVGAGASGRDAPNGASPGERGDHPSAPHFIIEGESLVPNAKISAGNVSVQKMDWSGMKYSGEQQLWWRDGGPGDVLTIHLEKSHAPPGVYDLALFTTLSYDYAKVKVTVDGQSQDADLYRPHLGAREPLVFHGVTLKEGAVLEMQIEVVGKNEAAHPTLYYVGFDRIELTKSKSRP